jgi:hypothetical protein
VSIAEIVDRRGVLLVNAGRGRIGTENSQACMHFIFQLLDRHMPRLMEIPEDERPRTAVICDEAHYLFSRSVIKQIATHRAAGMDMTAGIQYMSQLGAEAETAAATAEIRDGVAHLLHSKFLFRITEPNDADREVRPAMAVVTTMTQQDPDSRTQRRVTPKVMMNIEDYYCVASQIIAGARAPAYIGRTYPMQNVSRAWAELHLERMRERLGPKPEPPRYGGGWVCWKKLDGYGERFEQEPVQSPPDAEGMRARQETADTAAPDGAQERRKQPPGERRATARRLRRTLARTAVRPRRRAARACPTARCTSSERTRRSMSPGAIGGSRARSLGCSAGRRARRPSAGAVRRPARCAS